MKKENTLLLAADINDFAEANSFAEINHDLRKECFGQKDLIFELLKREPIALLNWLKDQCAFNKDTPVEVRKEARELHRRIQRYRGYMTVKELFKDAVERAKADAMWPAAYEGAEIDYMQVSWNAGYLVLKRCEFDVAAKVIYGGSEGIYADVYLAGYWAGTESGNRDVYTIKTLNTGKDAYINLGTVANLIAYYANEVVSENIDRFD